MLAAIGLIAVFLFLFLPLLTAILVARLYIGPDYFATDRARSSRVIIITVLVAHGIYLLFFPVMLVAGLLFAYVGILFWLLATPYAKSIVFTLLLVIAGGWLAVEYRADINEFVSSARKDEEKKEDRDLRFRRQLAGNWIEKRSDVTMRHSFQTDGNWKVTFSGTGVRGVLIAVGNAAGVTELTGYWSVADGNLTLTVTQHGANETVDAFVKLIQAPMDENQRAKELVVRIESLDTKTMLWHGERTLTRIGN